MNITGTIINYYFHCKRQCWLFSNRINLEDNSQDVKIGKVIHKIKEEHKEETEISIGNIRVDKINGKYLIEIKKSDADRIATKWQLYFYLRELERKGVYKEGKIEYIEKNNTGRKVEYIQMNDDIRNELIQIEENIIKLIEEDIIPKEEWGYKCKKCAYMDYCYI